MAAAQRAEPDPQAMGQIPMPGPEAHALPIKALLVDAAGTLISPSESVAAVYLDYARHFGCSLTEAQILQNFRKAFASPWEASLCRYQGDGRPFW